MQVYHTEIEDLSSEQISEFFEYGWQRCYEYWKNNQINFNISLSNKVFETPEYPLPITKGKDQISVSMPYDETEITEKTENIQIRLLYSRILSASNTIINGQKKFIITNFILGNFLQSNSSYYFPTDNSKYDLGKVFPIGCIAGITVYIDPRLTLNDNRILLGTEDSKEETNLFISFCVDL